MTQLFRLPSGGRINRQRPIRFSFDGTSLEGYEGDTLASALLANGVHLVGRSFKYHRPRGIMSAGSEEPNALVAVGADEAHYTPNIRATQVELREGLVAESQNRWPSLKVDVGAITDLLFPVFAAGFYYKTFMWPRAAWKALYEPVIRRVAGLGRAPTAPDADRYTQIYQHCDVLVIGSGPAGIAAALTASSTGAHVIVCDEQSELGGSLLSEADALIDGQSAGEWLQSQIRELSRRPNVTLLQRTTAFGWYPHNMIGLCERVTDHIARPHPALPRERLWQIRAKEVVLATGALERPLSFPDNDRPGIMLAEAARTYVNRYAVRPGTCAVVFAASDGAYRAALDLHRAGISIAAIADLREGPGSVWLQRARSAGIDVYPRTVISGTAGRLRVRSVTLSSLDDPAAATGSSRTIQCDLVLVCGGFSPNVNLFSQSRGKLGYDEALQAFIPRNSVEQERSVGACCGVFGLGDAIMHGLIGGAAAAQASGFAAPVPPECEVTAASVGLDGFIGEIPHGRGPGVRAWVDFQNDVTSKDVQLAIREGFRSIEHIKRYTTTGMATDQGKTSNMNALGIVSKTLDMPVPDVGLTTFRPPYTPTTFGLFGGLSRGDQFDPIRRTPVHDWAQSHGAIFEDVSLWKRVQYFPRNGEDMHTAVARECMATRTSLGIFDASTLGKIEVVGPDAAEFLNRMYINAWSKLEVGRLRYGVMLREDGFIMDDGVVGRISDDRFHVTTTTGGAVRVLNTMEDYLQTEWPTLDVWLTSTTEQWSVIAVQGPNARRVLELLVEGIDISQAAMPHMSVRTGRICGVPTRLFRVSFTGELGFEVNVPAGFGAYVWEEIFQTGQRFGITPYGTQTMHVLRAEKGYIIVGQETDGTVTPDDVGLSWAIGKAKKDFVGKRSLSRPAIMSRGRKQLVGLLTSDPEIILEEGAQIVEQRIAPIPVSMSALGRLFRPHRVPIPMLGHITSSYWSAALNRSIALALIKDGRSRKGTTLFVPMFDRTIEVQVVEPVFYDPKGQRLDA
jgi:sarcosine oxidase subunit alpha